MRKSEQVSKPDLYAVEEDDDENELTQDIEKPKQLTLEHDFINVYRKDRSATFKPYNYVQNSEAKESQISVKNKINISNDIIEEVKLNVNMIEEDDQQSNGFDLNDELDDESSEKQIAQIFKKQSNEIMTINEPVFQQEREVAVEQKIYFEEDKLEVGNSMSVSHSSKSKSKFSVPESEKYDPYAETAVISRPTDILDPIEKVNNDTVKVSKSGAKSQLSITRIQQSINKFKNAGKTPIPLQPQHSDQPMLNISQQAKELGYTEVGNRRSISPNQNEIFPGNINNNESPVYRSINDNQRRSILTSYSAFSDNTSNNQRQPFMMNKNGGVVEQMQMNDNNHMMNNFMSQMMMLMQQNTALMSQHQEILKTVTKQTGSNKADINIAEPLNQDFIIKNAESKTQLADNDNFSSLNEDNDIDDREIGYDQENVRAASVSVPRKQNIMFQNVKKFKKNNKPSLILQDQNKMMFDERYVILFRG